MQIHKESIKNILVIRNDRFGEFLLNIPAMRALKETFSNARIILIVDPYVKELAKGVPFIDEIIEWSRATHSLMAKLNLIGFLRRKHIDIAVMLNPSREFNIITWLSGISIRVGYNRKLGFLLTHKIKDEKYLGKKHEVEYNLELVGLIGAKTEDETLSLKIDDRFGETEGFNNLIAIHPFTSDPIKQWPYEYFVELTKRLIKELNVKVAIVGSKEELGKSCELFDDLGNGLIDLTGKTTLRQLAAVLNKCRLLISGDSGPVHLSACVGTPVIAIFRSDIPAKSAKRWGPWDKGHVVIEKNNLSDISIDEVFNKAKEILG